jgi:hypothetical protein
MPTLTWLTREHDLRASRNAPYRLLEEVPECCILVMKIYPILTFPLKGK